MNHPILKKPQALLYALALIIFPGPVISQVVPCLTTGWKNATSFSVNDSVGVFDFASFNNAENSDDLRAVSSTDIAQPSGVTYYLQAMGFGFAVPLNATLCGVSVEIECRAGGNLVTGFVKDDDVRLLEKGYVSGDDRASPVEWTATDVYRSYGGEQDLWDLKITPEVVNLSNFGVAISVNLSGSAGEILTAEIDHIRMKVDFKMILAVPLEYFKATKSGNKAILEWKTGEEEKNTSITLQRSFNNQPWEQVKHYDIVNPGTGKKYIYQDIMKQGSYSYRLQLKSPGNQTTYSNTVKLNNEDPSLPVVYPSLATDHIIYRGSAETLKITDMAGRQYLIPASSSGPGSVRLDIQRLQKGFYVLQSSAGTFRFVKQ